MDKKPHQQAIILLALDALKFDAGDWKQESIERHLREQIKLAETRLLSLINENEQLYLVFSDWEAGHHGLCPNPMPVVDAEHAKTILDAMSNCVIQGQGFKAKLCARDTDLAFWFICEDYVNNCDGWAWEQAGIAPGFNKGEL